MRSRNVFALAAAAFLVVTGSAMAQQAPQPGAPPAPSGQAPTSLSIYFAPGSAAIRPQDAATLDEASRIFNDGKPIVMMVTGMADATGAPDLNLLLSQRRADVVFAGLVARGLPPSRFQILAKGASEALSSTQPRGPNPQDRKVEITWR